MARLGGAGHGKDFFFFLRNKYKVPLYKNGMLVELFIFYQVVALIIFFIGFWTRNEIVWALSLLTTGFVMIQAWNIETYVYQFNETLGAYAPIVAQTNYPALTYVNLAVFALALILAIFDVFTKYIRGS